MNLIIGETEAK